MKTALIASVIVLAACANEPTSYDDPVASAFNELERNRNSNATKCSYSFDAVEAAAATLNEAIQAGDEARYAADLDSLKQTCDGFYSIDLFPDSFPRPSSVLVRGNCAVALMKAGPRTIGRQMIERVDSVCEIARGLPADLTAQPSEH